MARAYNQNLCERMIGPMLSGTPSRLTAVCSRTGAICAIMALTAMPSESQGGAISFTEKSIIGLSSPVDQIHYHRHFRRIYHQYRYNPDAELSRAARNFIARELRWDRAFYGSPYYGYSYGWGQPCYAYNWSYSCNRYRWSYPPY